MYLEYSQSNRLRKTFNSYGWLSCIRWWSAYCITVYNVLVCWFDQIIIFFPFQFCNFEIVGSGIRIYINGYFYIQVGIHTIYCTRLHIVLDRTCFCYNNKVCASRSTYNITKKVNHFETRFHFEYTIYNTKKISNIASCYGLIAIIQAKYI